MGEGGGWGKGVGWETADLPLAFKNLNGIKTGVALTHDSLLLKVISVRLQAQICRQENVIRCLKQTMFVTFTPH
jgi:hypothetical protein